MTVCVRCQRSANPKVWSKRAEVNQYGVDLCFTHDLEFKADIASLTKIDGSDPERAHGAIDEVLLKWAPRPLAKAAVDALERQPWVAGA